MPRSWSLASCRRHDWRGAYPAGCEIERGSQDAREQIAKTGGQVEGQRCRSVRAHAMVEPQGESAGSLSAVVAVLMLPCLTLHLVARYRLSSAAEGPAALAGPNRPAGPVTNRRHSKTLCGGRLRPARASRSRYCRSAAPQRTTFRASTSARSRDPTVNRPREVREPRATRLAIDFGRTSRIVAASH